MCIYNHELYCVLHNDKSFSSICSYVQVYVSLRISVLLFHVCCRSFLGFFAHKMLCCLENDMAMYISILHYL